MVENIWNKELGENELCPPYPLCYQRLLVICSTDFLKNIILHTPTFYTVFFNTHNILLQGMKSVVPGFMSQLLRCGAICLVKLMKFLWELWVMCLIKYIHGVIICQCNSGKFRTAY